jgi:hypothetical protein
MRLSIIYVVALSTVPLVVGPAPAQSEAKSPRLPAVANDDAWKKIGGQDPPLPSWALALAEPLPRTTGAMLHLDYVHRAKNPLGPILAGKLHWAAATAINCDRSRHYAEADLRRAGLSAEDFKQLAGDIKKLPFSDRLAVEFAIKLSKAAYTVTDEEVAELVKLFGADKVVGMVHTLAWANFQNRIILALGAEVEPGGPLPPFDPQLDADRRGKLVAPARPPWKEAKVASVPETDIGRPDWLQRTQAELDEALDQQKARKPRVPLPEESADGKSPPSKVRWNSVSFGYQPLLTEAWFDTMRAFQQESKLERVFSNSYFWVITRTNECFY